MVTKTEWDFHVRSFPTVCVRPRPSMIVLRKKTTSLIHAPVLPPPAFSLPHLDWPLQLWLLITEPHHPDDCHGDAEPVEEAEEVYDGDDVVGEGVEQRHQALEREEERSNQVCNARKQHITFLIELYKSSLLILIQCYLQCYIITATTHRLLTVDVKVVMNLVWGESLFVWETEAKQSFCSAVVSFWFKRDLCDLLNS